MKSEAEQDAWQDGYRAYCNHLSQDLNPFNNNDEWELYKAWRDGWYDAAWDD